MSRSLSSAETLLRVCRDRRRFAESQAYLESGAHRENFRERAGIGEGLRLAAIFLEEILASLTYLTASHRAQTVCWMELKCRVAHTYTKKCWH